MFEAMATFVGQISVLSLIAIFGAATTAMVSILCVCIYIYVCMFYKWTYMLVVQITTARKAVTLLLSYLIFTKPLTEQHCSGLILISMGIIMKMLPENKPLSRVMVSVTNAGANQGKVVLLKEVKGSTGASAGGGGGGDSKKERDEEERRPLV